MSEIVNAIKALYDQHNEKVEKLKTVVGLGVTQEDLEKYERQSLESCHAASAKLLKNDLITTFGADGVVEDGTGVVGTPLGGGSYASPRGSSKKSATKRSDNVALNYKCQECGKSFVNAGNLKNHQYAHEREVRVRQSIANVSAAEFMDMIATTNKDVAAAIKQIIGTDKEATVAEAFPQLETTAGRKRRLLASEGSDGEEDEDGQRLGGGGSSSSGGLEGFKKRKSVGGASTRKAYTLQEKLLVLEKHDELVRLNELKDLQFNVGRIFNISQSLVSKWLKQRAVIEENAKDSSGKRLKYHYKAAGGNFGGGSSSSGGVAAAHRGVLRSAPDSPHSVSSSDSIELIADNRAGGGGSSSGAASAPATNASSAAAAAPSVIMFPKKKGRSSGAVV